MNLDEFRDKVADLLNEIPDDLRDALARRNVSVSISEAQPPDAAGLCYRHGDIVLFYPWLKDQTEEEIRRVLRHEIGHACGFSHKTMPAELMRS